LQTIDGEYIKAFTVVLREDVTVVTADRLHVLVAIFGDTGLDWNANLLNVVSD
jgi:hypothetical protein